MIVLKYCSIKELVVDVAFRDILETVKVGDTLQLKNEPKLGQNIGLREDARVVTGPNTKIRSILICIMDQALQTMIFY